MILRKGVLKDSEAIARMTALSAAADGRPPPALDVELVRAHAFGPHAMLETWIAEAGGEPVGCAVAHLGYDVDMACPTLVVGVLYVAPEARRSGLARMLLAEVAERAIETGAREIMITTGLENSVARALFASVGASEHAAAMFVLGRDQVEWLAQEGA